MSEEKKKKNKIIGISLGILVVLLIVISSTYAYWQITKTQESSNDIIAACLSIDMESVDGTFSLNPAWPISDEEGMQLDGYTFKVTNNCEEDVNYIIGMDSLVKTGVEYLNYDSVKLSVDNNDPVIYGSQETIEHIKEDDPYQIRASKKLYTATVKGKVGDTPEENTHNVKVWIKAESDLEDREKVFSGRMFITGGQKIDNDKPLAQVIATGDISRTENDDVKYYLYDDGRLIISGTGEIKSFIESDRTTAENIFSLALLNYIENSGNFNDEEIDLIKSKPTTNEGPGLAFTLSSFMTLSLEDLNSEFGSAPNNYNEIVNMVELSDSEKIIFENIITKLEKNNIFGLVNKVLITDGVTSIGEFMFGRASFKKLYTSDSVTRIRDVAFVGTFIKDELKLSKNLKILGSDVFLTMYSPNIDIDLTSVEEIALDSDGHIDVIESAAINSLRLPATDAITKFYINELTVNEVYIPENIQNLNIDIHEMMNSSLVNCTVYLYGPERPIYSYWGNEYQANFGYLKLVWNYKD